MIQKFERKHHIEISEEEKENLFQMFKIKKFFSVTILLII